MEKYDVVIIGSGLGGLVCGSVLSKEGKSVCVIEKNRQIGGSLQTFSRDKRIIDTGVHYVGGLDEGQNLNTFFKYLGLLNKLNLQRLDNDGFDIISFEGDDTDYKFAQGYENFIETLLQYFPNERKALTDYCNKIQKICKAFPMYNIEAGKISDINSTYMRTTLNEFITAITTNKKLQNVLMGNNLLYAGQPNSTPVFIHALITNSNIQGSWKFVDGSSQLSKQLGISIRENGGKIIRNCKAENFVFDNNELKYVQLPDGKLIEGKTFISNIHPATTIKMLETGRVRKAYKNRINSLENTISSYSLYLMFKENSFEYMNHNRFHFSSNDVWSAINYQEKNWPESYMFCTPASSRSPKYANSGVAMCYMRYDEVRQWEQTFNTDSQQGDRGSDYEEFKNQKSTMFLSALESKYNGIKNQLQACYASTPLTYRDYIGNADGSLYGIARDAQNPLKSFIASGTKVPNLYLTGQNIHMAHGVLGVTIGALLTCSEILGLDYMLRQIKKVG